MVLHLNKLESPSCTQRYTVAGLVEIGPEVLEKIFKFCQCIFANLLFSPLGKGRALLNIWTNLNPLHPRMLCAKFGWNWSRGSREEDENVKSLQTDRWTEKLTWAFSSGELKRKLTNLRHIRLITCRRINQSTGARY